MKINSKKYFGFTLVELIIVITILAILATIAFVSFQNYTSQTRDTKRVSDLSQISKGLDIFQVTSGTLPTPDNPTTYTGGNVTLLKGKINSKVLSNLGGEVFDPSTKTEYTYATIGNGKYYQIGADSENLVTSVFQNTYADAKSSIVKGNYLFDPSLPSLIISSGSSLYDPNNCFVINGGTNLISNTASCTPKTNTSLKNFDNSLVGYWDMETTTGSTFLKDLSVNGNDGDIYGNIASVGGTGGRVGKALLLNTGGILINKKDSLNQKDFTISAIFNTKNSSTDSVGSNGITYQSIFDKWICGGGTCAQTGAFWLGLTNAGNNNGLLFLYYDDNLNYYSSESELKNNYFNNILGNKQWYILSLVKKGLNIKIYMNGSKIFEKQTISEIGNSNNNFYIGNGGHSLDQINSPGVIDDVKYYSRALSDDEILQQAKIAGF